MNVFDLHIGQLVTAQNRKDEGGFSTITIRAETPGIVVWVEDSLNTAYVEFEWGDAMTTRPIPCPIMLLEPIEP